MIFFFFRVEILNAMSDVDIPISDFTANIESLEVEDHTAIVDMSIGVVISFLEIGEESVQESEAMAEAPEGKFLGDLVIVKSPTGETLQGNG